MESPRQQALREITGMLREVTGEGPDWAEQITAETRLEDDLWLESIELAELEARMRTRYGEDVDLLGFLAGLGLDELVALRVGDLAELVVRG